MAKEYIEREAAIAAVECTEVIVGDWIRNNIQKIPAADVAPVVRGRWKKSYADHEAFGVRPFFRYCSECHEATVYQYNYCPNCGAKMEGEDG